MKRLSAVVISCCIGLQFAPSAAAQVGKNMGVGNPNLATVDELLALPHVDEALASAVVEHRPFLTTADLHAVLSESLGEEQLAELYVELFLPLDLNTASEGEILLVPGVGNRLAHEFEEYRPYRALAQFRREIGKYIDDDELATIEQYVFVPIDINAAGDEAISSIPGVGPRMLREFKEYRPYKALAQFRREIGKYVDDDELARLERYITIDSGS